MKPWEREAQSQNEKDKARNQKKQATWQKNHPEEYSERLKEWRKNNPEYMKEWMMKNPEHQREWRKAHPEKVKEYSLRQNQTDKRKEYMREYMRKRRAAEKENNEE